MFNNPYWAPATPSMMTTFPYPVIPTQPPPVVQQTQPVQQSQPAPQQTLQPTPVSWNWKAVANYQSMLMESVPFDGAPVLFMLQNEPVFYVVRMEEGRKMVNGFTFTPLDNPEEQAPSSAAATVPQTPEAQLESRLTGLENNMNSIMTQLQKLVEGNHHESINEHIETQEQPIAKRKPINSTTN